MSVKFWHLWSIHWFSRTALLYAVMRELWDLSNWKFLVEMVLSFFLSQFIIHFLIESSSWSLPALRRRRWQFAARGRFPGFPLLWQFDFGQDRFFPYASFLHNGSPILNFFNMRSIIVFILCFVNKNTKTAPRGRSRKWDRPKVLSKQIASLVICLFVTNDSVSSWSWPLLFLSWVYLSRWGGNIFLYSKSGALFSVRSL